MAYRQYTQCVSAQTHVKMNQYIQIALQSAPFAGVMILIASAKGDVLCDLIVAEMVISVAILLYCQWWLNDRLVCLDGDQVAVGMVISSEPAEDKPGVTSIDIKGYSIVPIPNLDKFDTDFTTNLLLFPNSPGADRATVETSKPFGKLVAEQAATRNEGLDFTSKTSSLKVVDNSTPLPGLKTIVPDSCALHAEFEGAGVYDLRMATSIALFVAAAALALCLLDGIVGTILAYILAILAFLIGLIGGIIGLNDDGSPADVNPALNEIHTNKDNGKGADLLLLMGTWVYDSGHNNSGEGWNEIHPVKFAKKVGTWDGRWPDKWTQDPDGALKNWEATVKDATSPVTVASLQEPENQWAIHPCIDGCQPAPGSGTLAYLQSDAGPQYYTGVRDHPVMQIPITIMNTGGDVGYWALVVAEDQMTGTQTGTKAGSGSVNAGESQTVTFTNLVQIAKYSLIQQTSNGVNIRTIAEFLTKCTPVIK
jgi:hypothetical protein